MKTGNRVVDDIVRHTHQRCARIIGDAAELLDDDDRLLFITAVLGHVMAECANGVVGEGTPGEYKIKSENMMIAAMVLIFMVDPEGLRKIDLDKAIGKTQRLVDKLWARP